MDKSSAFHPVFLHHNRGVKKLAFTVRADRELRYVRQEPFNLVLNCKRTKQTFIVTKGRCAQAVQKGRIKLTPYTGRFPTLALLWTRFVEVVRG